MSIISAKNLEYGVGEETKFWHLSPKALYELYKQEKVEGHMPRGYLSTEKWSTFLLEKRSTKYGKKYARQATRCWAFNMAIFMGVYF